MKNKLKLSRDIYCRGRNLLFVMKLTILAFFLGLMGLSASTYSQKTKLSIDLKNVTISEVLKSIESQSEFVFIYENEALKLDKKVSVMVNESSVDKILTDVLKDTGVDFEIVDKQIVITKNIPANDVLPLKPKFENESQQPQKKNISGRVRDSKGQPLPGATVVIKGTTIGVVTDANGQFKLNVTPDTKIISVSFIGMKPLDISIAGKTTIEITLQDEVVGVDEVVVVGYGTQKKASVTGAISTVGSKLLLQSPQANISNALVGRMPGLLSVQRSGQPGADQATLRIRGAGTFTGSTDPLIMVDGIETDNYNNIDPNEIESIAILKDASATAVYGVRGANGVLIITTKRGQDGKPQVSYSVQHAISNFTNVRHSMNAADYAKSFNMARRYTGYSTGTYNPAYTDAAIAHYTSHDDPIFYPDVDWFPYMFGKSSGQTQHNLNISGGTDKVKYFVSLGYFDQGGLINNTNLITDYDGEIKYKRYNIRGNFDFNITKRFSATINLSTQIENRTGTSAAVGTMFDAAWAGNPTSQPLLTDGKYLRIEGGLNSASPMGVLFNSGTGYQKDYRNYLNSSVRFNYDLGAITKGLSTHATVSYNNFNTQVILYRKDVVPYIAKRLPDQSIVYVPQIDPSPYGFSETFGKNRKVYVEAGLDYSRKFGDHNLGGLLLYNQSKRFDPNLAFLVPNGYQGIVGRVTYDYKNRYLAEVNVGYNGTENFAPGKRFGFFPAYSLGWVATEEPFFPKNEVLSYLKIRGSYGVVGNDKIGGSRFLYRPASYSYVASLYQFGEDGSTQLGYQGSVEGALGNPDLTWERAKKLNIGTDFTLFKDKIKITAEYFDENRDNILANKNTVPIVVAATLPAYNLGKMSNSGYEAEITYTNAYKKFNYWVKANYTYAHNVIEFQDEVARPFTYQNRTGQRMGQNFGLVADGLFNSWKEVNDVNRPVYQWINNKVQPGDIRYVDINGDGMITGDDAVPIGYSDFPEKVFGLSLGGSLKGFDFSVLFQGAANVSIAYSRNYTQPFLEGRNAPDYWVEAWSQERLDQGLPINFPHLNEGYVISAGNYQGSTFWTADASYVRLKNAEIGYALPAKLLKRVGLTYLRLYINGSNLFTWDSMLPGADPESAAITTTNNEPYPITQTFNFGFNVKF